MDDIVSWCKAEVQVLNSRVEDHRRWQHCAGSSSYASLRDSY